jgi:glycosyltransferase involved in cell wall biosynthesis
MNTGVSVVICCHNSAQRLPETLRHLAAQHVSADFPWEVVVIDNASKDDTAQAALDSWPASAPAILRVVFETQAGLSYARIRGIQEARYPIISFIDDDNWTAADWLTRVSAIFEDHPETGACGGRIEAVCEIAPPAWFDALKEQYAVGQQYARSGDITNSKGTLLCGAGLSLRTDAIRKLLDDGFVFMMSGRKGASLMTGEDTELCFALRAAGWRFYYDEELVLRHFIPKARLQWDYAQRLLRGGGGSSALFSLYLFALKAPPFDSYPAWKKTWLFQISKGLRETARLMLFHPAACLRRPEGSLVSLKFERAKQQVATLWELRGRYGKLQEDIARSTWVKHSAEAARP